MARKGYTEAGYPIVWRRWTKKALAEAGKLEGLDEQAVAAKVHKACMQKMRKEAKRGA